MKNLLLFPQPRSVKLTPGDGAALWTEVKFAFDSTLGAEDYTIHADSDAVTLTHGGRAGLQYGLQTVDQMRRWEGLSQHVVEISDSPDFAIRGFLLDVADVRVPHRRMLKDLVRILSAARVNQLELYVQHTYAYAGHDVVWRDTSPLTADDIEWLDRECLAHNISLVANQNVLGHMEHWLLHSDYLPRAESPEGFYRFDRLQAPTTLEPTEDNRQFAMSLVRELTSHMHTKRINIGADEPWELGQGASKEEVASRGLGTVYFDYISKILRELVDDGYRVEFWADVFGEHPELMGQVPEGAIPLVWQYDGPTLVRQILDRADDEQRQRWESVGADMEALTAGFRGRAKVLIDAGEKFWVAPGISTWLSFVGRLDTAVENMIDAAEVGLEYGSEGYINTWWGNTGCYDPVAVWLAPTVFGGAVSWCLEANRDTDLAEVLNEFIVEDPTGVLGDVLVEIGHASAVLNAPAIDGTPMFTVLLGDGYWHAGGPWPQAEDIEAADGVLARAKLKLCQADPAAVDGPALIAETDLAIDFARFGLQVLTLGHNGVDELAPVAARTMLNEYDRLIARHRELWTLRSQAGGIEDSVGRFRQFRQRLVSRAAL